VFLAAAAAAVMFPVSRTMYSGDPIMAIIPNLLLFTPYRKEVRSYWKQLVKIETDAKDFTFEALKFATEGFRYPAIVRGLFAETAAAERWIDREYLSSRIGEFVIVVVSDANDNTLQTNASC
jgi:hypothetical protein